MTYIFNLMS